MYWGHGKFGIEAASQFYYGKHPSLLHVGESALLAGILPCPEALNPITNPKKGKASQARGLRRMVSAGFLDLQTAINIVSQPLCIASNIDVKAIEVKALTCTLEILVYSWLMNFRRSNLDLKQNGFVLNVVNSHEMSNCYIHKGKKIISELNFPFCAQCEHHLLPFHGVVHIGWFQDGEKKAIDRCSLQSMVHFYGCKLQVQERLTRQIAEAVYSVLGKGVMVVVEANHICMMSRGIEKVGSSTATIAVMGEFSTDATAKALFLEAISKSTATGT